MSVLFTVLKIAGAVLLVLVLLLLAILLLALFCPFTYRARGSWRERTPDVRAHVAWLGGLLAFLVTADGDGAHLFLRIAGICLPLGKKKKTGERKADAPDVPVPEKPLQAAEASVPQEPPSEEPPSEEPLSQTIPFGEKLDGLRQKFTDLCDKAPRLKKKFCRFLREAKDERNRAAVRHILAEARNVLGSVFPGKIRLTLSYSAGSPDKTGQVLGVFAMLPVVYRQRWDIRPDFTADAAYADADFDVRGRVFGICILLPVLRIILDKNCQRLYNKVRAKKRK